MNNNKNQKHESCNDRKKRHSNAEPLSHLGIVETWALNTGLCPIKDYESDLTCKAIHASLQISALAAALESVDNLGSSLHTRCMFPEDGSAPALLPLPHRGGKKNSMRLWLEFSLDWERGSTGKQSLSQRLCVYGGVRGRIGSKPLLQNPASLWENTPLCLYSHIFQTSLT